MVEKPGNELYRSRPSRHGDVFHLPRRLHGLSWFAQFERLAFLTRSTGAPDVVKPRLGERCHTTVVHHVIVIWSHRAHISGESVRFVPSAYAPARMTESWTS